MYDHTTLLLFGRKKSNYIINIYLNADACHYIRTMEITQSIS